MFRSVARLSTSVSFSRPAWGVSVIVAGCGSTSSPAGSIALPSPASTVALPSPPASLPASPSAPATSTPASSQPSASVGPRWTYVALGDSCTYGAPGDCNNCTTYPSRWAAQITAQTGMPVELLDLSEHDHLTSDLLVSQIDENDAIGRPDEPVADELAKADIITISVGGNDLLWSQNPWPSGDPCYPKYDATCLKDAKTAYATSLNMFTNLMSVGLPARRRSISARTPSRFRARRLQRGVRPARARPRRAGRRRAGRAVRADLRGSPGRFRAPINRRSGAGSRPGNRSSRGARTTGRSRTRDARPGRPGRPPGDCRGPTPASRSGHRRPSA